LRLRLSVHWEQEVSCLLKPVKHGAPKIEIVDAFPEFTANGRCWPAADSCTQKVHHMGIVGPHLVRWFGMNETITSRFA
jgi:hypothetical protein